MKIHLWIKSYQNHVVNCAVYIAVGAACMMSVHDSDALVGSVLHPLRILGQSIGGIAALLLLAELNFLFKRVTLPPGDSGLPLLGDLPRMIQHGPREVFLKRVQEYGSPCTHNMLMDPTIIVSSDEDVNKWLAYERRGKAVPSVLKHFQELLGSDCIVMESAKEHRRLRRIFEPSFAPKAINGYVEILDAIAKEHLDRWASSGDFHSSKEWSLLAMRLFFACAFGEVDEELLENLNRIFLVWFSGTRAIIPYPIPGTTLWKAHKGKKELVQVLQGMVDEFKHKNPPDSDTAKNSMMGRLCCGVDDDGKPLTGSQLINNIALILFAGHDTTKGSFCAFVHYLDEFPKIRKMLVEEAQGFSEPLDADELKNAPLLNAFMAETWRLVAPLGDHVLQAKEDIDFNGYTVRKGVQVALSIQGYNSMKGGRYQDPDEFHLGRWLPKGHQLHDPKFFEEGVNYNFMSAKYRAFNFGAHSCLGAHFAKMEARIVLTRLLQSYDFQLRNDRLNKFPLLQYDNEFMLTKRPSK